MHALTDDVDAAMGAVGDPSFVLSGLDDWQRRAVVADDPAVLVRAQVGSGKTTVLTAKVMWLLANGVRPEQLAVLTFTNRAAASISHRIAEQLGGDRQLRGLTLAGTFHSVARTMLSRRLPVQALGYRRDFTVMDETERDAMWRRLIAKHGLTIRHKKQLSRRMDGLADGKILHGVMKRPDDIVRLAELSHAEKLRRNAMDFDDLVHNAHGLLCDHPLSPPLVWLLIDELQDCDADQLDLAVRMCGPQTRIFAVGDPNQIIYSWRGSGPSIFEDFAARTGASVYSLPRSYRCPAAILTAAQRILTHTGPAVAPPSDADLLVADRDDGPPMAVMPHHDEPGQARWIVARVRQLLEEGLPAHRIAVLGRTRRCLTAIISTLREASIAISEQAPDRAAAIPVLAWWVALLRAGLVSDAGDAAPADDEGFCIALTDKRFGLCADKTLTVERLVEAEGQTAQERRIATLHRIGRRSRGRRAGQLQVALQVTEALGELTKWLIHDAVDTETLVERLHLDTMLVPTRSGFEDDRAHVDAFTRAWLTECRASHATDVEGLATALEVVANGARSHRPSEGVAVLTIHASKGLEYDSVLLVSANDGLIPIAASWRDPDELAEERRLLFVALTRACRRIEIGWLKSPGSLRIQPEPSPLLELLGDAVDWLDAPPDPAPKKAASGLLFAVGAPVRHPRYGPGVVTVCDADHVIATFGKFGDKSFSTSLCPLKRA